MKTHTALTAACSPVALLITTNAPRRARFEDVLSNESLTVTLQEQARYNYRMLQDVLGGFGWQHDDWDHSTQHSLMMNVDSRGLLTYNDTEHIAQFNIIADTWGFIVTTMHCESFDGEYFNRTALSVQSPINNLLLGSWEYMSAPLARVA